jgi:hypothetical protein
MTNAVRLVGLAALVALLGVAARGATPPTITIETASVSADWRESWLTGSVRFSGSVGATAELTASLRPARRPGSQKAKITLAAGADGRFAGLLKLPNRLLPDVYLLRVWGTSSGANLTPIEREVTVPAPREGVVDRGFTSLTKGGSPTILAKGPRKELWAHFHFLVPPKSGRVTATWYTPSFKYLGTVTRLYKADFDTFVRAQTPLQPGKWWCILKSSGRVIKRARIRIS